MGLPVSQHRSIAAFIGSPVPAGLTQYWRDKLSADPTGRSLVLTLDLRIGDRQILAATEAIRTTSGKTGVILTYPAILQGEVEVEESYEPGQAAAVVRSITVAVPNKFIDAAALVAQGRLLYGVAELSIQVQGGDTDHRWVLMRGVLENATFGRTQDSLFEATLRDPNLEADASLPPYLVESGTTFAAGQPHASAEGQRYPVVVNYSKDTPALFVIQGGGPTCMYAVGHRWTVDTATGVKVNDVVRTSTDAAYGWINQSLLDKLGVPYSAIVFTVPSTVWAYTETVNVTCTKTTANMIVDVVEELLRNYSGLGAEGVDRPGMGLAEVRMNAPISYSLGAAVTALVPQVLVNGSSSSTATGVLSFIEEELLAGWPSVSMAWQNGRYGPVYTDQSVPVVGELIEGKWPAYDLGTDPQEVTRTGSLILANTFTYSYAYDLIGNYYGSVRTKTPTSSALCRVSRDAGVGDVAADPIESRFIRGLSNVEGELNWLVRHRTLPAYYVELTCAPEVWFRYRLGDNIKVTLTDLFGGSPVTATITRKVWRRTGVTLGLHLWWSYTTLGRGAGS